MSNVVKTWKHCDMTCVIQHGVFDCPCGYVRLPKNHSLYGVNYDEYSEDINLDVHGGVMFSGKLLDTDQWFVGFDMAHVGDFDRFDWSKCIRTDFECES